MSTDIDTQLFQLWAGTRALVETINAKLPDHRPFTMSSIGERPGYEHELAGLAQIVRVAQAFTLELSLKALHQRLYPERSALRTHDLVTLFDGLTSEVKDHVREKWATYDRSFASVDFATIDAFLSHHRRSFERVRYEFENSSDFQWDTKLFDLAIYLLVTSISVRDPSGLNLQNLANVLARDGQITFGGIDGVFYPPRERRDS